MLDQIKAGNKSREIGIDEPFSALAERRPRAHRTWGQAVSEWRAVLGIAAAVMASMIGANQLLHRQALSAHTSEMRLFIHELAVGQNKSISGLEGRAQKLTSTVLGLIATLHSKQVLSREEEELLKNLIALVKAEIPVVLEAVEPRPTVVRRQDLRGRVEQMGSKIAVEGGYFQALRSTDPELRLSQVEFDFDGCRTKTLPIPGSDTMAVKICYRHADEAIELTLTKDFSPSGVRTQMP